ncbi:uncharacterized protein M421DRAFT_424022 [Didymella exigua CBS 183.55]|uniref:Uncharacterized protein n=1 Tax=Didymella exigua CBS 183.55 TaxID=1150837 RepID=A0A6A5RD42_9PLEO|nr:uncharacterized protein M421DRAFT_424022 [Didymella exigua CBS 183.55]KAF1925220.1 hypothetical protein M421DRAFT_424022 [Didymella exigua CBS 183.55]
MSVEDVAVAEIPSNSGSSPTHTFRPTYCFASPSSCNSKAAVVCRAVSRFVSHRGRECAVDAIICRVSGAKTAQKVTHCRLPSPNETFPSIDVLQNKGRSKARYDRGSRLTRHQFGDTCRLFLEEPATACRCWRPLGIFTDWDWKGEGCLARYLGLIGFGWVTPQRISDATFTAGTARATNLGKRM